MIRLEFPRAVKETSRIRSNGKCERCGAVLADHEGEYDHILPASLGGKPELANCQRLCKVCHKEKTAKDVGRIRKADRQHARHTGTVRDKPKIASRGFERKPKIDKLPIPKWHDGRDR